jgi:hypothetical protein
VEYNIEGISVDAPFLEEFSYRHREIAEAVDRLLRSVVVVPLNRMDNPTKQ